MAKRFTDSEKWERPWFRKLPCGYKLLWIYILDKCDISGIWYVDMELASFVIGEHLNESDALKYFEKQIKVIDEKKWFIVDFVEFQYGELVANNNLHRSVISRLEKNGLGAGQGQASPLSGAKDKVKDKDKDKDNRGLLRGKHSFDKSPFYVFEIFRAELKDWPEVKCRDYHERAKGYSEANGGKYFNWIMAVKNWERKDSQNGTGSQNNQKHFEEIKDKRVAGIEWKK